MAGAIQLDHLSFNVPDENSLEMLRKRQVPGPMQAQRWKFSDPALPWPITAELWRRDDGELIFEASIKIGDGIRHLRERREGVIDFAAVRP